MSGIRVRDLTKAWGVVRAVDAISFDAAKPEFVVLLGPSGCGKSTTLRLIAGLEQASAGTIEIAGRDVTALPASKRNLSMVFQSYALFPHLNVAENIVFGLSIRGVPKPERAQRLARVADLLGLTRLLDRRPSQLSGGQQQRVALGRALIAETPVCLLDEPLSNLDAQLRAEMRAEIRGLQQRLGITMLFVTHDQTEAMSMADRIILMREGRIEQNGAPADLYERPASSFVARFIGTPPMHILDLVPAAGGLAIAGTDGPVVAPADRSGGTLLGVRPEHVAFADIGVPARVVSAEYFGADTITTCRVGSQAIQVRSAGRPALASGSSARLRWDPGAIRLFDAATGAAFA